MPQAKSVVVPVDDMEVKTKLREHGQPACECDIYAVYIVPMYSIFCDCGFKLLGLFGEGPADRRERLRQLLAGLGE